MCSRFYFTIDKKSDVIHNKFMIKTKISTSFALSKLLIQTIKVFLDSPMANIFRNILKRYRDIGKFFLKQNW